MTKVYILPSNLFHSESLLIINSNSKHIIIDNNGESFPIGPPTPIIYGINIIPILPLPNNMDDTVYESPTFLLSPKEINNGQMAEYDNPNKKIHNT